MEFRYGYSDYTGLGIAFIIICVLIGVALGVVQLLAYWKIFKKAGEPGWAAIVPFYNMYVLYRITWGEGLYFLFLFLPIANVVFGILTSLKLARVFGKSEGFGVGLIFLNFIFTLILAFGDAVYTGVPDKGAFSFTPAGPAQGGWTCTCGTVVTGNYCPVCGTKKPDEPKKNFCPNCGTAVGEDRNYCPNCGNKLK